MNIVYVLLVQRDDNTIPPATWITTTQREAANTLREYASNYLGGFVCDANDMPLDEDLVRVLRENGEHAQVFKCVVDGVSGSEIDPFVEPRNPEARGHETAEI
jgi:hypothetical protein